MKWKLLLLCLALAVALSGCRKDPEETPSSTPAPSQAPAAETPIPAQSAPPALPTAAPAPERPFELSADYGPLVPFQGGEYVQSQEGTTAYYPLCGLVTLTGEVVAEPMFSAAYSLSAGEERVLVLTLPAQGGDRWADPTALCASDGSWCTGFDYRRLYGMLQDGALWLRKGETQLVRLSPQDGREAEVYDLAPALRAGADPEDLEQLFYTAVSGGGWTAFTGEIPKIVQKAVGATERWYLLNALTGEVRAVTAQTERIDLFQDGLAPAQQENGRWGYIDTTGDWAIPPEYMSATPFYQGKAAVADGQGWRLIDREGSTLWEAPQTCARLSYSAGLWVYTSWDPESPGGCVDGATLTAAEAPETEDFSLWNDWFYWEKADSQVLWRMGVRWTLPASLGSLERISGDKALFCVRGENMWNGAWTLVDLTTGERRFLGDFGYVIFSRDSVTEETYLYGYSYEGNTGVLMDLRGKVLARAEGESPPWMERVGGLTAVSQSGRFSLLDGEEEVFSWAFEDPEAESPSGHVSLGSATVHE